ncbi:MAG: phosphatidylglycerophosphatase A [Gammaproteobacteria bacterium]|nr:phosphatidylglycerophosphatase A [Gammaproteobacteria bacterium]
MASTCRPISFREFATDPVHWLALGFGSGLVPRAPGTFGTLAAVPLHLLLLQLPWSVHAVVVAVACIGGVLVCGVSARRLGVHDHPAIVWDEIAAFLLLALLLPAQGVGWLLAAFLLFRLFDIWKPWPIREMDHRIHGGTGIMLDDLVAALYAWVPLFLASLLIS